MKKVFAILLAFMVTGGAAFAQHTSFGLKAGLNISSVKISDGDDYDSKAGLHVGGLAHIHISPHFAIQPEIVYSMQGGKSGDTKLNLNYVNIPVLFQYMFDGGFRLQTGPQLGFMASAKSKTGDVEVDVKDDLASIDFAWSFGASYLFPGANGIGADLRYNVGISNISDNNNFEARNNVLQVGLFYQFVRGK
jgi:hypothetical protein